MSLASHPYLKIDHVDKTYARGAQTTEVLADITVAIDKGEFVSIIGHSGCGKSTLLNIVAGLTPVTAGAVLLENREVNDPGPDRAVVFQNHSLLPWLTVYDNVRLAVDKVFGATKSRAERHAWTMHNLELVQMAHAKDKRPMEISGGMKQRVGIGFFIWDQYNSSRISDIVVALTWVGLVGFALDRLVALAGRIVSRGASAS